MSAADPGLARRLVAELLGTALLLVAVVGSGIMAERLAGGNIGVALLANTLATGAALAALILAFGPVSGAHFNPAVSVAEAMLGRLRATAVAPYLAAQVVGALLGVLAAHAMFEEPLLTWSRHARSGPAQALSEGVATFGLVLIIHAVVRHRPGAAPAAVAAWITAAYWCTASTSFANPAVTVARACSDTFAGIRPSDVPPFVLAQGVGAAVATLLGRWLFPAPRAAASSRRDPATATSQP